MTQVYPVMCSGSCRTTAGCSCATYPYQRPFHIQPAQPGWECPRCRRINAPAAVQCPCGPQPSASDATGKIPARRERGGEVRVSESKKMGTVTIARREMATFIEGLNNPILEIVDGVAVPPRRGKHAK